MKCTNCGKNNAVSHYRYQVNGRTYEAHLCPDCARELQPEREFAAMSREMFGDMLDGGLFGLFDSRPAGGLLGGLMDPFGGLFGGSMFAPFAALGMPRIEISFPEAERAATEESSGAERRQGVDPELARRRELNALREQMRAAAESEDYEQAARLRDKLRALENGEKKEQ